MSLANETIGSSVYATTPDIRTNTTHTATITTTNTTTNTTKNTTTNTTTNNATHDAHPGTAPNVLVVSGGTANGTAAAAATLNAHASPGPNTTGSATPDGVDRIDTNGSAVAPAWTRDDSVEPPAGEQDMGDWTAAVYTIEQQDRLGVDAWGEPDGGEPDPGSTAATGIAINGTNTTGLTIIIGTSDTDTNTTGDNNGANATETTTTDPTDTTNNNTTTTTNTNTNTTIDTNATVFNGASGTNAAGTTTINATVHATANATALLDDSGVTKDNAPENGTATADIAGNDPRNDPRINPGGTSTSTSLAPELIVVIAYDPVQGGDGGGDGGGGGPVQPEELGFDHPGWFLATCYCYNGTAFVAPGRGSITLGGTEPVDCVDGTERICEARFDVIHSTMMAVAVIAGCCAVGAVLCSQWFCCRRRCAQAMGWHRHPHDPRQTQPLIFINDANENVHPSGHANPAKGSPFEPREFEAPPPPLYKSDQHRV